MNRIRLRHKYGVYLMYRRAGCRRPRFLWTGFVAIQAKLSCKKRRQVYDPHRYSASHLPETGSHNRNLQLQLKKTHAFLTAFLGTPGTLRLTDRVTGPQPVTMAPLDSEIEGVERQTKTVVAKDGLAVLLVVLGLSEELTLHHDSTILFL
ncbi:hypothetical protein CC79DRAFT_1316462 [Sarocladium strictum]